ncbi:MAG: hypothetical protein ABIV50_14905 [Opitutus sp.]
MRLSSSLLLRAVIFSQLPAPTIAQSSAPTPETPTLAERLDRNRIELHLPAELGGRTIFEVERVEIGVELTPDTFTLRPSTKSGRGK